MGEQIALAYPIRIVFFDFGNVLSTFNYDLFLDQIAPGASMTREELGSSFNSASGELYKLRIAFESGWLRPTDFFRHFCKNIGRENIDYGAFAKAWTDIFTDVAGVSELWARARPDVTPGLISNTNAMHYDRYMCGHPFIHRNIAPQRRFLSYKVGVMKPDPSIFQTALDQTDTAEREALLVDDLNANCDSFRALGGQAIKWDARKDPIELLASTFASYGICA